MSSASAQEISPASPLQRALAAFDAINAHDPNLEHGEPKELVYARRMSAMLLRFDPQADAVAQLAVRAQHIERWKQPRSDYPMTREGYLAWRSGLYRFHAERAADVLRETGHEAPTIAAVQAAVGKRGVKQNPATQCVEDIAALVFLEHYLHGFAASKPEYSEEKWLEILRKTWKKMSPAARDFATSGAITLPAALAPLIHKAVNQGN